MSFKKVILGFVAIVVGLPALLIALYVLKFFGYGALKHVWNTYKAEAINEETWETGFADVYSVESTFQINDQWHSASMDVVCARKIETSTVTIKGGPYFFDSVRVASLPRMATQIADNYSIVIDVRAFCHELANEYMGKESAFTALKYRDIVIQYTGEPVATCQISVYSDSVRVGQIQFQPMTVVSMRKERVRDVLSFDEFGPADRQDLNEREQQQALIDKFIAPDDRTFRWSKSGFCWWSLQGVGGSRSYRCAPWADEMCTPTQ